MGRGEAASALAHDSVGRRSLWVKERELEQELEEQEKEPSENPLCAAARRPSDITWSSPPALPLGLRGPPLRPIAEPHYLIGPPKRGRVRGHGATGRGHPGRFRSL